MLGLTDTHCHIQSAADPADGDLAARWAKAESHSVDEIIENAAVAGVNRLICVGCSLADSRQAVDFVANRPNCWASIGIHPHEAKKYLGLADKSAKTTKLANFAALASRPKVVAVGETGLDYYYNHSPKADQLKVLRFQLELAQKHDLPLIFHVREAFADFWPVFDEYKGLRGVIHSFTADQKVLDQALARGLYIGLNGIMTFTKDQNQLAAAKAVPLSKLLLETDAPFLTPSPFRGRICEPKDVRVTADFLSRLRGEELSQLAAATSRNASDLFNLAA